MYKIANLIESCKLGQVARVKELLEQKILPTQKCLHELIRSIDRNWKTGIRISTTKGEEITELLVRYGYKITYEDILFATKEKYKIENIDQYDIIFPDNQEFTDLCYSINFFPYLEKLKPQQKHLQIMCKTNNFEETKRLISLSLVPDYDCLLNACGVSKNLNTIRYLTAECELVPDMACLYKACDVICNKPAITFLLNNFELKPDITCLEKLCKSENIVALKMLITKYKIKPNIACLRNYINSLNRHNKNPVLVFMLDNMN